MEISEIRASLFTRLLLSQRGAQIDHAVSGLVQPIQAHSKLKKKTPDEAYAVMLPTVELAA